MTDPSAETLSEAIVVWTGYGVICYPQRDERRVAAQFGIEAVVELVPLLAALEEISTHPPLIKRCPDSPRWQTKRQASSVTVTRICRTTQSWRSRGVTPGTGSSGAAPPTANRHQFDSVVSLVILSDTKEEEKY